MRVRTTNQCREQAVRNSFSESEIKEAVFGFYAEGALMAFLLYFNEPLGSIKKGLYGFFILYDSMKLVN